MLQGIDKTAPFIEGRLDQLKSTHMSSLEGLFTSPYDENHTQAMYQVAQVHVNVNLPAKFMSDGMSLINEELFGLVCRTYEDEPQRIQPLLKAICAIRGVSLLIMQQSYQLLSLRRTGPLSLYHRNEPDPVRQPGSRLQK